MTDPVTRAEFAALDAKVDDLREQLAEALRLTGCTDPDNNRRDRLLRDRQAWRESPEGQAHEAALRDMADWWRRDRANKDEARQRLGDWAARLGLWVTVVTVLGGIVTGATAGVTWLLRWTSSGGLP